MSLFASIMKWTLFCSREINMIYLLDTLIQISVSSLSGLLAIGGVNLLIWCETAILIQRSAKVFVRGCEKLVIALAYLFCLALVGSCLARFAYFLADLCIF